MSFSNIIIKSNAHKCLRQATPLYAAARHGHTIRGKPPGEAKTLEQRLHEENPPDAELEERINIGFPKLKPSRAQEVKQRLLHLKTQRINGELEKQARSNSLCIDLEQVQQDYNQSAGQYDLRVIADHYGIFKDLFGCAFFIPRVPLDIKYEVAADTLSPVYNGNIIKPAEAAKPPQVNFNGVNDPITGKKASGESFWTLIATNPDGHFKSNYAEYVHWFVANIPNGDVAKGDILVDYMQPFPPKGIGYQRFVFVLYKQTAKIDFSEYKIAKSEYNNLDKRTFKTLDFYRKYQEEITPAGLAFFQTNWDKSLTNFYHTVLQMKEPIFEYDFPKPYLADQKWFPLKQPFNLYMDKHRDIKQVNKEYLERKLAQTHPFDGPAESLRFPNAHRIRNVPSWQVTEIRKQRLSIGRINDYK